MPNASTDIIIIGAGIAGLAAGCYAQMNGYRTEIFELHDQPGGLCTSWERQGYTFDGCIHYLLGSAPGKPFHHLWQELGISQTLQFIHHQELIQIRDPSGKTLIVYCDPDPLESHLTALSPQDKKLIHALCNGIRSLADFDLSLLQQCPRALMGPSQWLQLGKQSLPFLGPMVQWGRLSTQELATRFRDPFLRRAIPHIFSWPSAPVIVGLSLLAAMAQKNAGFPVGGSAAFARAIAQRYQSLGGTIHYNAQVERVLIEHNHQCDRAIGVRLYSNEEAIANRVISACDGHNTLYGLLQGQYNSGCWQQLYNGRWPIHSQLQVSLGVNRSLTHQPHWLTQLLDHPITIAGQTRFELSIKHYGFDPSLAPSGKSVVIVTIPTPYQYWQRIYGRPLYHTEEAQDSQILIDALDHLYPGLKGDIEAVDVATPLSYERYTGNWQGSSCGWLLTKKTMPMMIVGLPKTLPGLQRFYQIGQWVEPGGSVPIVALSGRNIIQQICAEDHKAFASFA